MNTKQKVIKILKTVGMDLWTLSQHARVSHNKLAAIQLGEIEPDHTTQVAIDAFVERLGLCPDCLNKPCHIGGCVQCTCGWGKCS